MADDEDATVITLRAWRAQITAKIGAHRGQLADFTGDNFLASFASARDAVQCAIEIQRALATQNAELPEARRMRFRLGIHVGDVRVEEGRLYGDGVNVAARLQTLAEPGDLCLSQAAVDSVRGRVALEFEDIGPRALKNLPTPVQAFRARITARSGRPRWAFARAAPFLLVALAGLLAAGFAFWATSPHGKAEAAAGIPGAAPLANPALPELPSVAVLPFANSSGDLRQESFADGISADLTSALAQTSTLFVISRSSAFTYKGKAFTLPQVGRELGVRYVVEGSVRRSADRVRVTAELIEASSGRQVWSDSFNRELTDIFAVQSEIAEKILGGVGASISHAELERIRRRPTESLTAYEACIQGFHLVSRFQRGDTVEARRLFLRAIELDPNYALPVAYLGVTYAAEYTELLTLDPAVLDRADALLARAIELDPSLPNPYVARGAIDLFRGQPERGRAWLERARALAPNDPGPHIFLALVLLQSGQLESGWASFERGRRLNPRLPATNVYKAAQTLAAFEIRRGRAQSAEVLWEQLRTDFPDLIVPRLELAARFAATQRAPEARTVLAEALRVNPQLTAAALRSHGLFARRPDLDAFLANLSAAGLP